MPRWDEEAAKCRKERVREMTLFKGSSSAEIAQVLGVSERTVNRDRSELGIGRSVTGLVPYDVRQRAREMLQDGVSYTETARTLKVSHRWLTTNYPGYGWTQREGSLMGRLLRDNPEWKYGS